MNDGTDHKPNDKKSRRNDGTFLVLFVAYGGNAGKEHEMFTELYYDHADSAERVLPYLVVFRSKEAMYDFMDFLKDESFRQVTYDSGYRGLFINMRFKTFGPIQKAVKPICVDDRHFTPEEFMSEIFYG